MIRTNKTITLLTLLFGLSSVNANASVYTFETLDNNADPTFNQLLGINDTGTIAGYYGSGAQGHPNIGYTLGQSGYIPENFPGSVQTQVTGINNNGVTVGFWSDQNNLNQVNNNFGFVDNHGVFTNVNNPGTGSFNGVLTNQLLAVNDNNIAAGFYINAQGVTEGETYNINNNSFSSVNINGAASVTAAAINNANEIGGFYTDQNGNIDGFILNGNNLITLQAPGEVTTEVLGLNNNGLADGLVIDGNNNMHGFVYNISTGQYNIVDDPNGIGTTTFNGINDQGQITGFYVDSAGFTDGLLANPIPEPSILALIVSGILGLAGTSRRRYA